MLLHQAGPAVFACAPQRRLNSAKIYRMDHPWTLDDLCDAAVELVRRSDMDQCYIRPILFRSLDEEHPAFGVNPFPNPLACYIGAWDWGKYLGDEAIERGVDVCVSTWNRLTPNSMPAMAKRRKLHELAVDQDGSAFERFRRRHRARRSWLRVGRLGRISSW